MYSDSRELQTQVFEPVFEAPFLSRISVTSIKVRKGAVAEIEAFLTEMISEYWQLPRLNDIKIFKNHFQNEFLIVMSCPALGADIPGKQEHPNILVSLEPLLASGSIEIIDNTENQYTLIE